MEQTRQTQVLRTLSRLFHQIKDWRISAIEYPDGKIFSYQDKTGQFSGYLIITIWSDGRCEAETEGWFKKYQDLIQKEVLKLNKKEGLP